MTEEYLFGEAEAAWSKDGSKSPQMEAKAKEMLTTPRIKKRNSVPLLGSAEAPANVEGTRDLDADYEQCSPKSCL